LAATLDFNWINFLHQNENNTRGQQEILDYTHSLPKLIFICHKLTEILLVKIFLFLGQMFNVPQFERLWINTKKNYLLQFPIYLKNVCFMLCVNAFYTFLMLTSHMLSLKNLL